MCLLKFLLLSVCGSRCLGWCRVCLLAEFKLWISFRDGKVGGFKVFSGIMWDCCCVTHYKPKVITEIWLINFFVDAASKQNWFCGKEGKFDFRRPCAGLAFTFLIWSLYIILYYLERPTITCNRHCWIPPIRCVKMTIIMFDLWCLLTSFLHGCSWSVIFVDLDAHNRNRQTLCSLLQGSLVPMWVLCLLCIYTLLIHY